MRSADPARGKLDLSVRRVGGNAHGLRHLSATLNRSYLGALGVVSEVATLPPRAG